MSYTIYAFAHFATLIVALITHKRRREWRAIDPNANITTATRDMLVLLLAITTCDVVFFLVDQLVACLMTVVCIVYASDKRVEAELMLREKAKAKNQTIKVDTVSAKLSANG